MKPKVKLTVYFIIANSILTGVFIWAVVPDRVFALQGQSAAMAIQERQLALMEENLRQQDENALALAALQVEEGVIQIIQPPGQVGAMLTDIRSMLYNQHLREVEFYASEQAAHFVEGRYVLQIRAMLAAEGAFDDINRFLKDVSGHYRYVRMERIQIAAALQQSRLWLTFSIYEEMG